MFARLKRVRSQGKTYEYLQVVENVRFERGLGCPVHFPRQEHPPRHDQKLARQGHHGLVPPDLALLAPVEEAQWAEVVTRDAVGRLDQGRPEQPAPVAADPAVALVLAGLVNRGIQARVARHLLGRTEPRGVADVGPQRGRRDGAHASDRQQQADARLITDAPGQLGLEWPVLVWDRGRWPRR